MTSAVVGLAPDGQTIGRSYASRQYERTSARVGMTAPSRTLFSKKVLVVNAIMMAAWLTHENRDAALMAAGKEGHQGGCW